MYWKHSLVIVLVLIWCQAIVQSRYAETEDLVAKMFKQRGFDQNSQQVQRKRSEAWTNELFNRRKAKAPWMSNLKSLRGYENLRMSDDKIDNSRRGWPRWEQLDDILQESVREESGISYDRPLENDKCGRQKFAPSMVERIVGGHEAVPHSWPWQVLYRELVPCGSSASPDDQCTSNCGGTLINEDYILTAAHCINAPNNPEAISIIAGIHGKGNSEEQTTKWQIKTVQKIIIHEGWNADTIENDIALLKLTTPVTFNDYVQPACLPGPDPVPGSKVVLIGWGLTATGGELSLVLKQTEVDVIGNCKEHWGNVDDAKQLCFKDPTLTSAACQGDSGGPALQKHNGQWVVEGVTSFGHQTCEVVKHGLPDVYTRVSAFLPWIHSNIAQ